MVIFCHFIKEQKKKAIIQKTKTFPDLYNDSLIYPAIHTLWVWFSEALSICTQIMSKVIDNSRIQDLQFTLKKAWPNGSQIIFGPQPAPRCSVLHNRLYFKGTSSIEKDANAND